MPEPNRKMKKLSVILSVMLTGAAVALSVSDAMAETVMHKEAKTWAQTFFNAARGEVTAPVKMVYNGKDLTTRRLFTPFFIYNSPKGGFVIISGENKMYPVLGYSLTGSFDPTSLSPSMRALLKEYARQIEYIRYDSTVPEEAIGEWQNKIRTIDGILKAPVTSGHSIPDSETRIQDFALLQSDLPFDESLESALYTPSQWLDLINTQVRSGGSALIGVHDGSEILPVLVEGLQGSFYRMHNEGDVDAWYMRIFPSEVFSEGFVASLGGTLPPLAEEEEPAFAFHDEVMEMYPSEERARKAMLDELLTPSVPVILSASAGHYEISYPEPVRLVRVIDIAGRAVESQTYGPDVNVAVVNIEEHPNGFYIIAGYGDYGRQYPIKVMR